MSESAEHLDRVNVPALDAILGKSFKVLDDGFVRVVDYMGDDSAIVQAARVSYGTGTRHVHEDRGLIRYLMRHSHTTPFEMCEIKLHVRVPMDCWRQWIRHRTANVNEYSTRYSVAIDAMQRTEPGEWRVQSKDSKQGSAGRMELAQGGEFTDAELKLQQQARAVYEQRLAAGIAREQARKDLKPSSRHTPRRTGRLTSTICSTFSACAWTRMRNRKSAPPRTPSARKSSCRWCPIAWEAFLDYQFNSAHLSRLELQMMQAIGGGKTEEAALPAAEFGWLSKDDEGELKRNRERAEPEVQLRKFHMKIPFEEVNMERMGRMNENKNFTESKAIDEAPSHSYS